MATVQLYSVHAFASLGGQVFAIKNKFAVSLKVHRDAFYYFDLISPRYINNSDF